MTGNLVNLIIAVKDNDAKTAYEAIQKWTPVEREAIAHYLSETVVFLHRVNKDWYKTMSFPSDNEE